MKLENLMARAREIYSEERYARLVNIMALVQDRATRWERNIVKGEKGENIISDAIMEMDHYLSYKFPHKEEGVGISHKRRREKLEEKRHPDFIAVFDPLCKEIPRFGVDIFYYDAKYKGKLRDLGVVNVVDYDGYWDFISIITTPFKIFFYVEPANQIWFHDVHDPRNPDLSDYIDASYTIYNKPVYCLKHELTLYARLG